MAKSKTKDIETRDSQPATEEDNSKQPQVEQDNKTEQSQTTSDNTKQPEEPQPPAVYYYEPTTGEYIGVGVADPDQINKGKWLYPAYSTTVKPLDSTDKKAIVFDIKENTWSYVEDHRGEIWYNKKDGKQVIINYLGEVKQDDIQQDKPDIPEPPAPIPPLSRFQLKVILRQLGKSDDDIVSIINTISDPTEKLLAELAWQEATAFNYDSPIMQSLMPKLGLAGDQLKQKWIEASQIRV